MKKKYLALLLASVVTAGTVFTTFGSVDVRAATWQNDKTGWWWQEDNGTWPANEWKVINGAKYSFDANGYMRTGWYKEGNTWYYLGKANDGAVKTGWQKVDGKWYYFDEDGKMVTGWIKLGNKKYYLETSGAMKTGWYKEGNTWYYLGGADDGAMKTDWQKVNGKWYYMDETGKMAANIWVGSYYVDASGAWIEKARPDQWIQSGNQWWYRHSDGSYTRNDWETINGNKYHFDNAGWMQTGWQKIGGSWYYLGGAGDGAMKTNQWIQNYYVGADGKMATNTWIDNYYVGSDGAWVPDKKKETVPLKKIWIYGDEELCYVGDECDFVLSGYPKNTSVDGAVWLSSDSSIVTVDQSGHVKAVGKGEAKITAQVGEIKRTAYVRICKPLVLESIESKFSVLEINGNSIWICDPYYYNITPNIYEDYKPYEEVKLENWSFTFSDPSIADVEKDENGDEVLKGLKVGETDVTVTVSNKTTTFKLIVNRVTGADD